MLSTLLLISAVLSLPFVGFAFKYNPPAQAKIQGGLVFFPGSESCVVRSSSCAENASVQFAQDLFDFRPPWPAEGS